MSVSKTPAPRSLTALTIDAGGSIAPFSPIPFLPNVENGDGVRATGGASHHLHVLTPELL
jgi:hypothetical protein